MSAVLPRSTARAQSPQPADAPTDSKRFTDQLAALDLETLLDTPVLSASKLLQKVDEAPSILSVVNRPTIRAYGWTSLQQLVLKQPGISLGQDFERPTLNSRGLLENWGTNHQLLLIDGVPFNDPYGGSFYPWTVPLSFAENVEVLRGAGSVLYGSNAMNGVVAINSIEPGAEAKPSLWATGRFGNRGLRIYDLTAQMSTELASAVVAFQLNQDGGDGGSGFDASGRRDASGQLARFPRHDRIESSYLFTKLTGQNALRGFSLQFHNQTLHPQTDVGYSLFSPDDFESIHNARQVLALSYRTPGDRTVLQEYVLRLQRSSIDWDVRVLPNDSFEGFYPQGVREGVRFNVDDLFGRAQVTVRSRWGQALAGAEYSMTLYNGDDAHFGNVAVNDAAGGFPPLAAPARYGPALEGIVGHPLHRAAVYLQYVSPRVVNNLLLFTAGARYDNRFFNYADTSDPARPTRSKSFSQLSPRVTASVFPTETLSFKAIAGRSFREPALDELFTTNSVLGEGQIGLRPETLTTYELGMDWHLSRALDWRLNVYRLKADNQIGLTSESVSVNLYSRTNIGLETELLMGFDFERAGNLSGFANYGLVKLLDERLQDPLLTANPNLLTWVPAQVAKVGLAYKLSRFSASAQAMFQGPVHRRQSDLTSDENRTLRPDTVAPWLSVDAMVGYQALNWLAVRVQATNLLNNRGHLAKTGDFPFDFRIPSRRVMAVLEVSL